MSLQAESWEFGAHGPVFHPQDADTPPEDNERQVADPTEPGKIVLWLRQGSLSWMNERL